MALTPWGRRREAAKAAELATTVSEAVSKALAPLSGQAAAATRGASLVDTSGIINDTSGQGGPIPGTFPRSPFAQYQVLPRDMGTFGGPLGPGVPLRPAAIDPLRDDGRTDPRLTQYDPARNLNLSDRIVPFAVLRSIADQVDIVRRCIEIRKAGVTGLDWSFTLSDDTIRQVMAETGETNQARAAQAARQKYGSQIDSLNEFWEKPDRANGYTWSEWVASFYEEHLVLDAVPIWPHMNLGGQLHSFEILDGSTIKPLLDRRGARPTAPAPAFQQILWGFPRGEFVESDDPDDEFTADQLYYAVRNRRTFSPYGFSAVEQSIPAATLWLERQAWLRGEYTDSAMPQSVVKVQAGANAETWTPEQRAQYEQALNDDLAGQTAQRMRLKLLFPGLELDDFPRIDEKYKPEYDEFLVKRIGSMFGVSPTQLGVIPRTGLGGKGQQEGEQDQAETISQAPDLQWLVDIVNELSMRFLGMDRALTIKFDDGGTSRHMEVEANTSKVYVSTGVRTLNDVRADQGLPLYDLPEADEPMIVTATGPVFLRGTLDAQLNPPPPPPMPGMLPGQPAPQDQGSPDPDDLPDAKPQPPQEAKPDPAAAQAEGKKFLTYARNRRLKEWRDFEFGHVDKSTALMLNMYARSRDLAACERVVADLGKGGARSDRPGHHAETRILTRLVPAIRAGIEHLFDPEHVAAEVYRHVTATKDAAGDDLTGQVMRLLGDMPADTADLEDAIRQLYTAGYVSGRASGAGQVEQAGGTVTSSLDGTAALVDWSTWKPGDEAAAARLAVTDTSTGLAGLLDKAGIRIKDITGTTLDRMSTRLSQSLNAGDSVDRAARSIRDLLDDPTRAYLIAQTEMARAVGVATLDTYGANGIEQKEWLTIDRACPACQDAEAEGPIGINDTFDGTDVDAPPGHPGCLCTLMPSIGDASTSPALRDVQDTLPDEPTLADTAAGDTGDVWAGIDAMTDDQLDELAQKFMDAEDWESAERVGEYIDARQAPVPVSDPATWVPDPHDAFNPRTFEWYDAQDEATQDRFVDALPAGDRQAWQAQQYAYVHDLSAAKAETAGLPTERQMRGAWSDYIDRAALELEDATRGHALTQEAFAKGIRIRDLWKVNAATARKWASEDTLRYWDETGGRMTYAAFKAGYTGDRAAMEAVRKAYWA